ncbi:hypothetical protein PAMC26577_39085 [Caballeronia sordidicola]|uniref:Uncharacterized protein n=1 Tax=Caballeronia sordidicola TaxID=196367 RepID=A0A242M3Q7_CABSO|nr:hypothetical protein PAMC26577_39085 [Caballeronia sordidicola]
MSSTQQTRRDVKAKLSIVERYDRRDRDLEPESETKVALRRR